MTPDPADQPRSRTAAASADALPVDHAARLARLDVPADRRALLERDFARIFEAFRSLTELDVSGVEPMTGPVPIEDVVRADLPGARFDSARLLANAPLAEDGCYAVPKTISDEGR